MEKFYTVLAWITGIDPDIWKKIPFWNKANICAEYALLFVISMVTGVAWWCFWGMWGSWYASLFVGITAFILMFLLDRLIAGSDWRKMGVIAFEGIRYGRTFYIRLVLRIFMALVSSNATSVALKMKTSEAAITNQIEQSVRARNLRIQEKTAATIKDLTQRETGYEQTQALAQRKALDEIAPIVDKAQHDRAQAVENLRLAQQDMDRELTGSDGRPGGRGKEYRKAQDRADAASKALALADNDLARYQPRFLVQKKASEDAYRAFEDALARLSQKVQVLEREKWAAMEPVRQDAALSYMALQEILADPERGPAARFFGHIMLAVMMTIELSYLIVRTIFGQASIYMAYLIQDAKNRAAKIRLDDDDPPFGGGAAA